MSKKSIFILVFVFIGFYSSSQNKKAINSFQKAQQAFRSGDSEKGWIFLDKSIRQGKEKYYQPMVYAGDQSFREGQTAIAISWYTRALSVEPLSSVYLKRSIAKKYQFDWDESIEDFQLYLDNARLSKERKEEAEDRFRDLKFSKLAYQQYLDAGHDYAIQELPFSDEKMEYFPSLTGDGKNLIFTARHTEEGRPWDENLFEAHLTDFGWEHRAFPLRGSLNGMKNEGASSISANGEFMVFTACDRPGGQGSCDLYFSQYDPANGWTNAEPLQGKINTFLWESQPTLGPDGRTLYFVRGKNQEDDNLDIWVANMNEDGIWDQVHKLPRSINSTGREMSPFIHFDGRTLYFVSERSPSLGGSDFFKTSKLNDSTWSEPVNLGFPLNSFNDEFSMIVEPAGQLAYFSSNRGAELILINQRLSELDLYQCVLPESMRPTPTFNYQAWVVDSITGEPVGKASVQFYNRSEAAFFSGFSAEFTGKVSVMSPVEEMRITAYKKGYLPYSNTVTLLEWLAWSPSRNEIKLVPLASRRSFTLRNVLFELDKSSLLPESEKELNILYRLLHDEPEYKAQIIGHTDDQGTRSYNQRLSEARAETVKNWLIEKGIDSNRLISSGRGMDVPVASNLTEEGRALNRRTEVQLF